MDQYSSVYKISMFIIHKDQDKFTEISIRIIDQFLKIMELNETVRYHTEERNIYIFLLMYSLLNRDFSLFPQFVRSVKIIGSTVNNAVQFLQKSDVKPEYHRLFEQFKAFYEEIKSVLTADNIILCNFLCSYKNVPFQFEMATSGIAKQYVQGLSD